MPVVKNSNATLRPDIAAALREFNIPGATSKFIGEKILPIFRSGTKNGEYGVWEREQILLTPETLRTPALASSPQRPNDCGCVSATPLQGRG